MVKKEKKSPKCAVLKRKQKHKCLDISCTYRMCYLIQESSDKIFVENIHLDIKITPKPVVTHPKKGTEYRAN